LGFKNVDSLRMLKQGAIEAMAIVPYYVTRDEPLMGAFVPHGMLVDPEENLLVVDVQYDIARQILGSDKWGIDLVARSPTGIGRDLITGSNHRSIPRRVVEGPADASSLRWPPPDAPWHVSPTRLREMPMPLCNIVPIDTRRNAPCSDSLISGLFF
jgi:hypothetical protein